MVPIWNIDCFYLSFDEPLKEQYWKKIKRKVPWAKRVDGVVGFDSAHKECAKNSSTERFIVIDGDNLLEPQFFEQKLELENLQSNVVLSWCSRNDLNGLVYGNGGVKCWTRDTVMKMKTHENAEEEEASVDFCFQLNYLQMPEQLSSTFVTASPFQAFRAGFREGVKMVLEKGQRISMEQVHLSLHGITDMISKSNLDRLRIWCSVGSDIENGIWAIYGARLGLFKTLFTEWDYQQVRDYDWFKDFWEIEVKPQFEGGEEYCSILDYHWQYDKVLIKIHELQEIINDALNLHIAYLDESSSRFFKSAYINPPRRGRMYDQ